MKLVICRIKLLTLIFCGMIWSHYLQTCYIVMGDKIYAVDLTRDECNCFAENKQQTKE